MSDSRRVYRAIKDAVKQLYPSEPEGNLARQLNTLAGMVTGIVLGKSCQLPKMATKAPDDTLPASREKRFSRWTQNEQVCPERHFLPFIEPLVTNLARQRPLVFIMDGSDVGRGCLTLLVSVVYGGRALPLAWVVIEGCKGHFPTEAHVALLHAVMAFVPSGLSATFLGDGEFDSPELQAALVARGWDYVCRTAKNTRVRVGDAWLSLHEIDVHRGRKKLWQAVGFTLADYGPVQVLGWWDSRYTDPIYLVTNLSDRDSICALYRKRMHIETFFSDQKSRGFHLDLSHLSDPARLSRLMLAAGLAYLWLIYLGVRATQPRWQAHIHRAHRCDLSLFQMGLRFLDHLLNDDRPLPLAFLPHPRPGQRLIVNCVR
jgi:hypothetical protein